MIRYTFSFRIARFITKLKKGKVSRTIVRGRRSNASSNAERIMSISRLSVPRNVHIEQKMYESTNNEFSAAYTGNCDGICAGIVAGTSMSTRIGSRIQYTYISLRGALEPSGAVPALVRILILYDKEANSGTFATTAGVLLKAAAGGALINALAQYDPTNIERFKVLYDKSFGVQPVSSFAESNMIPIDATIPVNLPGVYTTGNSQPRGSLVMAICGYYASGPPDLTYTFRVGFTDD